MVDKGSLRSNKRSNSTSKDKDGKEPPKKSAATASKPTRSSSRRTKKAEEGGAPEAENAGEDVEMKDDTIPVEVASQIPLPGRKDNEGDVEMDIDEKSAEGEKKESPEDPVVIVSNGIYIGH